MYLNTTFILYNLASFFSARDPTRDVCEESFTYRSISRDQSVCEEKLLTTGKANSAMEFFQGRPRDQIVCEEKFLNDRKGKLCDGSITVEIPGLGGKVSAKSLRGVFYEVQGCWT